MTLYKWSQTASSNSSADATINWTEGQAPSSVNDSARAMMAAAAKYRDDNSGSLTTGGSSTAYTVTSNQVFGALTDLNGQSLRVKFHAANGATPTLNVDGLGAKSITTDAGTALSGGHIKSGAVVSLVYDNSNSRFVVVGAAEAFPTGTVLIFQQTAAPTGWTKLTSNNDAALRVVSGATGSGGTAGFTTAFAARTITQANLPNVNFTLNATATNGAAVLKTDVLIQSGATGIGTGGNPGQVPSSNTYATSQGTFATTFTQPTITGTAASGGSGTAMDFAVKYVDVIAASKD